MIRSLIYSITFHSVLVLLTILSLPFMLREPIDLPPIVSVELIQISDKKRITYAHKTRKIIEETKKKEQERLVSEQAKFFRYRLNTFSRRCFKSANFRLLERAFRATI